jgi:prepilin-type N-terminal cleavage/methylation domain-containing protein
MIYRRKITLNQKAFTIVELMIATAILSVILILVTAMMIGIGNLYYKGSSQAEIQDNIRSITDTIAQDLQLNGSSLLTDPHVNSGDPRSYCIGTTRYTYVLGQEITSASPAPTYQSNHVLWRDTVDAGTCPEMPAANFNSLTLNTSDPNGTDGTELIGPNSMLTNFSITGNGAAGGSPFTVMISEAYGSNDLLCDAGTHGDCASPIDSTLVWDPTAPAGPPYNVLCKGYSGEQFCATDTLTTTVSERL